MLESGLSGAVLGGARQRASQPRSKTQTEDLVWRSLHSVALAKFLPMTSTAPPVSAAAKQQHQNNDNEDQFHRKSP
jgi:hypothetical protein